jgi:acyl-homoserine lactone acylase PvdQ
MKTIILINPFSSRDYSCREQIVRLTKNRNIITLQFQYRLPKGKKEIKMTPKHVCISVTFSLLFFLFLGCSPQSANHSPQPKSRSIELMRDTWGVPHIFSNTDAGAMYGLGYASAEDRAFQMYYNLRIIQGRLAELVGDVKIGVTERRPQGRNSALRSDIKMRTIGYYRAAQKRHLHPGRCS